MDGSAKGCLEGVASDNKEISGKSVLALIAVDKKHTER